MTKQSTYYAWKVTKTCSIVVHESYYNLSDGRVVAKVFFEPGSPDNVVAVFYTPDPAKSDVPDRNTTQSYTFIDVHSAKVFVENWFEKEVCND